MNEQRAGLAALGWVQYAVIAFQEGFIEDYEVQIDGTIIDYVNENKNTVAK